MSGPICAVMPMSPVGRAFNTFSTLAEVTPQANSHGNLHGLSLPTTRLPASSMTRQLSSGSSPGGPGGPMCRQMTAPAAPVYMQPQVVFAQVPASPVPLRVGGSTSSHFGTAIAMHSPRRLSIREAPAVLVPRRQSTEEQPVRTVRANTDTSCLAGHVSDHSKAQTPVTTVTCTPRPRVPTTMPTGTCAGPATSPSMRSRLAPAPLTISGYPTAPQAPSPSPSGQRSSTVFVRTSSPKSPSSPTWTVVQQPKRKVAKAKAAAGPTDPDAARPPAPEPLNRLTTTGDCVDMAYAQQEFFIRSGRRDAKQSWSVKAKKRTDFQVDKRRNQREAQLAANAAFTEACDDDDF